MSSPKYKEGDRIKYLKAVESLPSYFAKKEKEEREGIIKGVSSFPSYSGLIFIYDVYDVSSDDDDPFNYDIVNQDDIITSVLRLSAPLPSTRPDLSYVSFPEAGLKPSPLTQRVPVAPAQTTPQVVSPAAALPSTRPDLSYVSFPEAGLKASPLTQRVPLEPLPKYKVGDRVRYLKSLIWGKEEKEEREGIIKAVLPFLTDSGRIFIYQVYDVSRTDDDPLYYDSVYEDNIITSVPQLSTAPLPSTRPDLSYVSFPEAGLKASPLTQRVPVAPAQTTPQVVSPAAAAAAAAASVSETIYTVLPFYDTEFKEIEFEMQGETVYKREILFAGDEEVGFSKYKYDNIDILIVNPLEKKNIKRNCLICDNKGTYLVFSIQTIQKHDSRDHAVIFCYDTEYDKLIKNTYYSSNSEGGFWRYCISREGYGFFGNPNAYYKGYNYTTTSFINFNIQMFLFKNMSEYNKITLPNAGPRNCVSYTLANGILVRFNRNEGDGALIDDTHKQYISNEFLFNVIDVIFPHVNIFQNYNGCIRNLKETLARIRAEPSNRDNDIKAIILEKLYNSLGKDRKLKYGRNLLKSPQDNYLETNPEEHFASHESIGRRQFYTEVYNVFSDLLEEYFVFLERESTKIMEINNYKLEKIIINMTIFKNKIRSKITDETFRIIYIKFNILGSDTITKMILNITPERNTLTPLGLDNIYVTAGSLIYKLFEYSKQADISFVGEAPSLFRRPTYTSLINVVNIRWLDRVTPL